MDMPQQELIEKVARSMLRAVFDETEVDPETCDLNWRGNDIWRCDFEEMAKAALSVLQPQLDAADAMRACMELSKQRQRECSDGHALYEAAIKYDEAKKGTTP